MDTVWLVVLCILVIIILFIILALICKKFCTNKSKKQSGSSFGNNTTSDGFPLVCSNEGYTAIVGNTFITKFGTRSAQKAAELETIMTDSLSNFKPLCRGGDIYLNRPFEEFITHTTSKKDSNNGIYYHYLKEVSYKTSTPVTWYHKCFVPTLIPELNQMLIEKSENNINSSDPRIKILPSLYTSIMEIIGHLVIADIIINNDDRFFDNEKCYAMSDKQFTNVPEGIDFSDSIYNVLKKDSALDNKLRETGGSPPSPLGDTIRCKDITGVWDIGIVNEFYVCHLTDAGKAYFNLNSNLTQYMNNIYSQIIEHTTTFVMNYFAGVTSGYLTPHDMDIFTIESFMAATAGISRHCGLIQEFGGEGFGIIQTICDTIPNPLFCLYETGFNQITISCDKSKKLTPPLSVQPVSIHKTGDFVQRNIIHEFLSKNEITHDIATLSENMLDSLSALILKMKSRNIVDTPPELSTVITTALSGSNEKILECADFYFDIHEYELNDNFQTIFNTCIGNPIFIDFGKRIFEMKKTLTRIINEGAIDYGQFENIDELRNHDFVKIYNLLTTNDTVNLLSKFNYGASYIHHHIFSSSIDIINAVSESEYFSDDIKLETAVRYLLKPYLFGTESTYINTIINISNLDPALAALLTGLGNSGPNGNDLTCYLCISGVKSLITNSLVSEIYFDPINNDEENIKIIDINASNWKHICEQINRIWDLSPKIESFLCTLYQQNEDDIRPEHVIEIIDLLKSFHKKNITYTYILDVNGIYDNILSMSDIFDSLLCVYNKSSIPDIFTDAMKKCIDAVVENYNKKLVVNEAISSLVDDTDMSGVLNKIYSTQNADQEE